MSTATGIWNHPAAGQALPMANPISASTGGTSATGSSGSASSASATISSNDFLTLLVTEMQNQDPTANTDPNEYVNQLVNVNSLEQLISINQTLSTAMGSSGSGTTTTPVGTGATGASSGADNTAINKSEAPGTTGVRIGAHVAQGSGLTSDVHRLAVPQAPGNLSIPRANPAAQRVAQALGGKSHAL